MLSRKGWGWLFVGASFVLAPGLMKLGAIGDLVDIALLVWGLVVVWQENGKSAAKHRAAQNKGEHDEKAS